MNITPSTPETTSRRVLNLKAVAICAVVAVVTSIGMRKLHSSQVRSTTEFLRQRAEETVRTGHPHESIHSLEMYLAFNGSDSDARQQLSQLLSEHAPDDETLLSAYAMNEDMLLGDANNDELRLRQARLAVRLNRFSDADSHLVILRDTVADNSEVWHLSGIVAERIGQDGIAESHLKQSIAVDRGNADAYALLTELMTRRQAPDTEAEQLLLALVKKHPSPSAWQTMAAWLLKRERTDEAVAALWSGLKEDPANVRLNGMLLTVLQSAKATDVSNRKKQTTKLVSHLEKQVARNPMAVQLRLYAAHARWTDGRRSQAIQILKDGVAKDPQAWALQETLVDYLVSLDETADAQDVFERIPRTAIGHGTWHFLQGRLQMSSRQWSRASSSFEQAHGFAGTEPNIQHRARMCQAVCRRELGHTDGAINAYRAMLQRDPTSRDGRLGIAAARLESGQTNLAIAEYRQLMDVKGVPELLTSLLIREAIALPESRRNWREVEAIISDESNAISDPVQKRLLRADLLFGKGRPAQALQLLDRAAVDDPTRILFQSARRRLLDDPDRTLRRRMEETVARDPQNEEAYVVLTRLRLQHDAPSNALYWIGQIRSGQPTQHLSSTVRLLLAAEVAESAANDLRVADQPQASAVLLENAREARRELAEAIPEQWPALAAFTARHYDAAAVTDVLEQLPATLSLDLQADCWLAAVRNSTFRSELKTPTERALRRLVTADPQRMHLRLAYSEYLTCYDELKPALQIARDIVQRQPGNASALRCCAWILTMIEDSSTDAMSFSESASRIAPEDAGIRTTRGLVLAMSDHPESALPVLQSIPLESRPSASWIYEAWVHVRVGNYREATKILSRIRLNDHPGLDLPSDRRLLARISAALAAESIDSSTL